jgi:glycerol-3-phosphate dehydrogenase subunit C
VLPHDENVKRVAQASFDVAEYVVDIAKREGLASGLKPIEGGVTVHAACHARAQNMGPKAAEMLRLLPDTRVALIERCSGHGGSWGVFKGNFETALKVGKPVARQTVKNGTKHVASECPLAGMHIVQGIEKLGEGAAPDYAPHPIELMARAWGLT